MKWAVLLKDLVRHGILYRLKLKKIVDSQQYADILTKPIDTNANFVGDHVDADEYFTGQIVRLAGVLYQVKSGFNEPNGTVLTPPNTTAWTVYSGNTLQNILSTNAKNLEINDAIIAQAEADAPKSGYETQQFFTLAVDENGRPALLTVDDSTSPPDASSTATLTGNNNQPPKRSGYSGYLLGDGIPANGAAFGSGIAFPGSAIPNDYYLRTDMLPNRLFRYDGKRWVKIEDAVRHTLSNTDTRKTHRTGFINNTTSTVIGEETVVERQAVSKALKPKADF